LQNHQRDKIPIFSRWMLAPRRRHAAPLPRCASPPEPPPRRAAPPFAPPPLEPTPPRVAPPELAPPRITNRRRPLPPLDAAPAFPCSSAQLWPRAELGFSSSLRAWGPPPCRRQAVLPLTSPAVARVPETGQRSSSSGLAPSPAGLVRRRTSRRLPHPLPDPRVPHNRGRRSFLHNPGRWRRYRRSCLPRHSYFVCGELMRTCV
jgi:hypothetical protein